MATDPTRPTLTTRRPKKLTLEEMVKLDVENLMLDPRFRRFMLTIIRLGGMLHGSFHSEAGASQFAEGRRSLGFDMLSILGGETALIEILKEQFTLEEATNGRRTDYDRNRELVDSDGADDAGRSDGDRIIDYERDGND